MIKAPDAFLNDFEGALSENISALNGLIGRAENQFLSIGQNLRDFRLRTRTISHLSKSAANALLEKQAVDAMDSLHAVLEQMNDRVQHSDELGHVVDTLNGVLKTLGSIRDAQPQFHGVIKMLRNLGVLTKIESAGLDHIGEEFAVVAADLDKLGKLIQVKAGELSRAEISVTDAIDAALKRTASLQAKERSIARSAVIKTKTNLGTLTDTHDQCSRMALTLSGDSDQISKLIGTVVESVQTQDMAAQRIVSVMSVLEQLKSRVSETRISNHSDSSDEGALSDDLGAELFGTCAEQMTELRSVRDSLIGAVDQIHDNLTNLSANMGGLVQKTRGMVGLADSAGRSFFSEMEKDFGAIRATLGGGADAEVRFNATLTAVSTTGENMAGFIKDIEKIRAEIKVIALEARIKATRVGERGATLFVIAASIHSLLEKTGVLTSAIAFDLGEVVRTATSLRGELRKGMDKEGRDGELQRMVGDLTTFVETFRDINDEIMSSLSEMENAVIALADDVTLAVNEFTVDRLAVETIDDVTKKLNEIIGPLETEGAQQLRGVVLPLRPVGTSADARRRSDSRDTSGLGANVELF